MTALDTDLTAPLRRVLHHATRLAHLRRFVTAVRQDGLRAAVAKARNFCAMQWRGSAHTVLRETAAGSPRPSTHYLHGMWQQLAQNNAFHVSAPPHTDAQRFVAIIGDLNLPQCKKYRVEQLAAFWRSQGVSCDYAHYEDLPRAVRLMNQATHLVEYRLQSNAMTEMLRYEARRLKLPVLYDIDDPLFSVSAYETYSNMGSIDPAMKQHFVAEAPKYLSMMNGADMISVSTPGLAKHAALYSTRPVHVRRNYADPQTLAAGARAHAARPAPDGGFRIAFASGSQGHEADFAEIAEAIEAFVMAAPKRRLLLLGHIDQARLPRALRTRTDAHPFLNYETYLNALARADCAVMPLADDVFNRCKSAVRVIDAAAISIPSVVGSVGDQPKMIDDSRTGYVARRHEDWLTKLTTLAENPEQTKQMGAAARQALEAEWSGQDGAHIVDPVNIEWVQG